MTYKPLLLALVAILPCIAHAQKNEVYFPYFELINLQEEGEFQYSSSRLLKTYIEANNDYFVSLPNHDRHTYLTPLSMEEALKEARQQNSQYLMTGEIHSLEGSFILSVGVYDVASGEKKWHDMIKGISSEDLDPLLSRIGRTFMTKNKASADIEVGEVSSYEQQGVDLQQIRANHFFGVMVGANTLLGDKTLSGFGLAYTFDTNTILFNVNFDYYFSSNEIQNSELANKRTEFGSFNMGVMKPLSRKRMTWFINGGMDYSFVQLYSDGSLFQTDQTGGVGLFAGAGYLLNRNATVNFRIQSSVYFPTYRIGDGYHPSIKFGVTTSISK